MWGILLLLLPGCGGATETAAPAAPTAVVVGDSDRGASLFNQPVIGSNRSPGCITCHSLDRDTILVGPPLGALTPADLENAEQLPPTEFLRLSIVEPDRHVTSGFDPGLMIQTYQEELTPQEIADLVAFLLTLRSN